MDWETMEEIEGRPILFTNAPETYDWGWTRTEATDVAIYRRCEPKEQSFRVVSCTDKTSLDVQRLRYSNGLFLAFRSSDLAELIVLGEWEWTPDKEVRYHYKKLTIPLKDDTLNKLDELKESLPENVELEYATVKDDEVNVVVCGKGISEGEMTQFVTQVEALKEEKDGSDNSL